MIRAFAPAKINLYLHVTGRRADGFHELDSLVAFASIGDELLIEPADSFSLDVAGPYAADLLPYPTEDNLVAKAAHSLAELTGQVLAARVTLVKNLPVASGIGGGSSDAAAVLRGLAQLWGLRGDDPLIMHAAERHGQDVPVCLTTRNVYMTASGVDTAPVLPTMGVVLVNPNKALPTPEVFRAFKDGHHAFSPLARLTHGPTQPDELIAELRHRTNDLYAPACRLMPEIADIIDVLQAGDQCQLARMSGSGATCFGLYADAVQAQKEAQLLSEKHAHWWVQAGEINSPNLLQVL